MTIPMVVDYLPRQIPKIYGDCKNFSSNCGIGKNEWFYFTKWSIFYETDDFTE